MTVTAVLDTIPRMYILNETPCQQYNMSKPKNLHSFPQNSIESSQKSFQKSISHYQT